MMNNMFFDEQYKKYGLGAQRRYPNESLIAFLAKYFWNKTENIKPKILEVGCGSGANLWMMNKENIDTYGIDSSAAAIDISKKHVQNKWGGNATVMVGDFSALPFKNEFFDAVVDVVSLQHIDKKTSEGVLNEIKRVLKDKGLFFSYRLSDHSCMYYAEDNEFIDEVTITNSNNGMVSFWSPSFTTYMYKKAGFRILSMERVLRTYSNGLNNVEYLVITAQKE